MIEIVQRLLKATIGSNNAAFLAGKTPNVKPIEPEIITVVSIILAPIVAGSGVNIEIRYIVLNPVPVPIAPPIVESINASTKN